MKQKGSLKLFGSVSTGKGAWKLKALLLILISNEEIFKVLQSLIRQSLKFYFKSFREPE